jgi:hypothetical protein
MPAFLDKVRWASGWTVIGADPTDGILSATRLLAP